MNRINDTAKQSKGNSSFFDHAMEIVAWLQIVASPLAGGIVVAGIVYFLLPNTFGLVIAIFLLCCGLVAGILLANKVRKKSGTLDFISRVNASPELDKSEDESAKAEQRTT